MLTRRTFTTLSAALLAAPLALGAGAVSAQELTKVTFVQPSPSAINSFNVFVAIGEGFFAEEGLDVTVESINGSGPVLQALSSGQAQFGRPGPGPVLAARGRDVDAVFIYNFAAKSNFGIVVPNDSAVQSPADLKGTVIGTGTADGAEVGFARNVLKGSGLEEGTDYTFLTVGDGGPATAAFSSGEMQAYSASTADAAILNQRGVAVRDITPGEYARFFGNGFITMGDTIRNNPELVEKFVRAIYRGHIFALDDANRDKVLAHMAAGNPQESEDPAFAAALFDAVRSKTIPVDMTNGYGYQPPEVWEEWQQVQLAAGELTAPLPDLTAAYTNEFTLKVNGSQN
ncbi:ABC transporter substrate-binding protein [Xinfangfangia sp. CPCC 101601]|uniref:Thiamine pyrimidine synthase n=1 Tax=Pseudogemmobacter lacusdianii TaxID=3069608 RepID=A0ABU0VVY3_9RHOB|nr:ABC transporter substrate-binding protein [Xinfangfangia sp. CPCC 101601]MDQ2065879.1 ABC transporter substrate-binding protein [Xinfangfangia sp. CPCC 101601]